MKRTNVLLTFSAVATLTVSGCSQPLSTADSCVEVRAIGATFPDLNELEEGEIDAAYEDVSSKFIELADKASDTLASDIELAGNFLARSGNDETPEERDAWDRLEAICELSD